MILANKSRVFSVGKVGWLDLAGKVWLTGLL